MKEESNKSLLFQIDSLKSLSQLSSSQNEKTILNLKTELNNLQSKNEKLQDSLSSLKKLQQKKESNDPQTTIEKNNPSPIKTSTISTNKSSSHSSFLYASNNFETESLKNEISLLEKRLEQVENELSKTNDLNNDLQNRLEQYEKSKKELEELKKRHETALIMLGEKEEQTWELKNDLVEVKQLYKNQINELISQIENLKKKK
jgi:DNA repair exonuclease SbcCD ATPase subunit